MPPRHHIDPQKTVFSLTPATIWAAGVVFAGAVVWVTVLVYDIRTDIRTLKAEIWTRNQHERFAYQLYGDNHHVKLVVREADGDRIRDIP
jgi:cell division protein FtsL